MKKLNVGIIGTGMAFERLHYPAYKALSDRYVIVSLCDLERQKAEAWATRLNISPDKVYTDYLQMLKENDELDVIDIMVPIELNFEVTEEVARKLAGQRKGIICEKPLAPTLDQAREARQLGKKYNLPIMIAENYRHNQEINYMRDLVQARRIGEVFYFIQNRVVNFPQDMLKNKFPAKEWRQHPEFPAGTITDTAVHDLGGLRHIFGPIKKLQAFGRPQEAEFAPYSVINANLLFKNGISGSFNFFCAGKEMQRPLIGLRIFGSEGMIYLEERDVGTINIAFNDGRTEKLPYEVQKGYYNELVNLHDALTGTEPLTVTPEVEYGDLKTVLDIIKSITEERIVNVDEAGVYAGV
ncbi:MAG: Gfo/Idh/MocA family oxidoreductase [Firmicutes bacterium]|nr:Gfo/Idh/MocA family oxidoreductase [Bacillota bacterium]